jgi:putative flippase GtrA
MIPAQWMARAPVRFVLVGGANTLLSWVFFAILVAWLPHQIALILAYALGVIIAWLGNSRWVFRARPGHLQALAYPLIYVSIWLVNAGLLEWLVSVREIGPRTAQALALLVIVPMSFALNAALLDERHPNRIQLALTLLPAMAVVFAVLWPVLGGFWLGDDFSNLYRAWELAHLERLTHGTLAFLASPVDEVGAFYRPAMMASISVLYVLFGEWYPGWAAASLIMHLVNTCLVILVIRRLLGWSQMAEAGRPGQAPILIPALAGLAFALSPLLLEGVVWISARSDAAVTLLTLAALWFWVGRPGSQVHATAWLLPLLMIPALGFKESAAVFPLQLVLIWAVWPVSIGRTRVLSLAVSMILVAAFFVVRTCLFGDPTEVYVGASASEPLPASVLAWFSGLFNSNASLAWTWLLSVTLLLIPALLYCRGQSLRLSLALLAGAGGLVLATLINLGALEASGEGGRLAYAPLAWWFAGLGLALAGIAPMLLTLALLLACVVTSAVLTSQQLAQYRSVQDGVDELVGKLPDHADQHPGLTLLLVPDRVAFVVAFRNAQGGMVMPPVQNEPMLHRILPTLPDELALREQQLASGLATRLQEIRPQTLEPDIMQALFEPADARRIDHLACWNARNHRLIVLEPPSGQGQEWIISIRNQFHRCDLQ